MRGVTYSRSAMARLPSPRAASSATRCSAGVSAPGPLSALRRGRAPAALSSSRGAPGEQQHAAAIRLLQRAPERVAGVRPPVRPAQRGAESDQGAGVLEPGR